MNRLATMFPILALAAAAAAAEQRPFDLYQPIIDRAPFGKPPPDFDPTASPTAAKSGSAASGADEVQLSKEQEELQKSVNATALVVDSMRTVWIGFTDTTDPKSPRNHYVPVGSSEDGWLVKEANPDSKTVTFEKDGVSIEVVVGKEGGKGPAPQAAGEKGGASTPAGRKSPLVSGPKGNSGSSPTSVRSLRQMRREREAAEDAERDSAVRKATEAALAEAKRQREEEAAKRAEEEAVREAEREAEREALRENLKALQADIEKKMAENRAREAESSAGEDEEGEE